MNFRVARHTNDLEKIKSFYINIIGFELLGSFTNHDGYDGIFVGKPTFDWHLEFTTSDELAIHTFDEDDILVFYPEKNTDYDAIVNNLFSNGFVNLISKNPYWNENGKMFLDPDGYRIVISNLKVTS